MQQNMSAEEMGRIWDRVAPPPPPPPPESPDGTDIIFDSDFLGGHRGLRPIAGPFAEGTEPGLIKL